MDWNTLCTQHPMMYQAKNEGRMEDPVILEIDTDVITWKDTRFSDKNSVRNDTQHGSSLEDFVIILTWMILKCHSIKHVTDKAGIAKNKE